MAVENHFDKLRKSVHQGVPLEKPIERKTEQEGKSVMAVDSVADSSATIESEEKVDSKTKIPEPAAKQTEKRKRKPQADYQSLFFNRIDFTHRKPLYITATTHRRLMRIVHLMDESKATISSYVENIILNHLDTFKDEIDIIYQTNNINPTEQ